MWNVHPLWGYPCHQIFSECLRKDWFLVTKEVTWHPVSLKVVWEMCWGYFQWLASWWIFSCKVGQQWFFTKNSCASFHIINPLFCCINSSLEKFVTVYSVTHAPELCIPEREVLVTIRRVNLFIKICEMNVTIPYV